MEITDTEKRILSPAKRTTRCFMSLVSCCAIAVTAYVLLHRNPSDETVPADKTLGRSVFVAKVTIADNDQQSSVLSKLLGPQPIQLAEAAEKPH
jgi:hypothetical protein